MKKLTVALVVVIATLSGVAGATAASATPSVVASPCCKAI